MAERQINLTALIDKSPITRLNYIVLAICFLTTLTEGFDLAAAAYTAPGIVKEWGISKAMLGPVFSAALFGMFAGSTGFGYIGDRFGRKIACLSSLALFGLASLACAFVSSVDTLIAMRFIMGIGAGGLLTNNISLISEYTPARRRASFVMLTAMGLTVGGGVVALTSSLFPIEAWRTIFVIAGIAPLAVLPVAAFLMPESIKFLASRPDRQDDARKIARRLFPKEDIRDTDIIVAAAGPGPAPSAASKGSGPSFTSVFKGKLLYITPLVWVIFICIQAAQVGLSSWLPTLLQDDTMSYNASAVTASMFYFGGILGALTIGRAIDRFGYSVLCFTFLLAVPVVISIGIPNAPQWLKMMTVFMTGYAVLGTQLGTNTTSIIYPAAFRSIGYGTASAVGRIGGIGGPIVFGLLMVLDLPLRVLLLAPVVPLIIGAIMVLGVARLSSGRFFGGKLQEVDVSTPARPAAN